MGIRASLDRYRWREWGFDLAEEEIDAVEDFFEAWFPIYNQPDIQPFRSQEALFASHNGLKLLVGDDLRRREQRNWVSASRAGYCVALTERHLRMRGDPDHDLRQLLKLMEDDDGRRPSSSLQAAMWRAERLTDVVEELLLRRPETASSLRGFELREAVFVDIRYTLFVKLRIANFPASISGDLGDLMLRWGHLVGVCEEALPRTEPVASRSGSQT